MIDEFATINAAPMQQFVIQNPIEVNEFQEKEAEHIQECETDVVKKEEVEIVIENPTVDHLIIHADDAIQKQNREKHELIPKIGIF